MCDGGDDGCSAIASSQNLKHLTELNLSFNKKEKACVALAQNPCLTRLRILNLSDNAILEGGCRALFESPYLTLEAYARIILETMLVNSFPLIQIPA